MEVAPNKIYEKQRDTLTPDQRRKAVVAAINVSARTVDIYFVNNPQTVIKSVPCSFAVTMSAVVVGQRCKVDIFDEKNVKDFVVAYTY
jgi:hypothetical protein